MSTLFVEFPPLAFGGLPLAAAAASPLPQVRSRHQFAASVWLDLAAFEDQRTSNLEAVAVRLLAQAPARASVPSPETPSCIT